MSRRRTSRLPRGISERRRKSGIVYLLSYADQHGEVRQELGGSDLREAIRLLAERRAEVEAGTFTPHGATSRTTLDEYARRVFEERAKRGVRSVDLERGTYDTHIGPARLPGERTPLCRWAIGDIRPRHAVALIEVMKATLSPKSVHTYYGVLRVILEHACFAEILIANSAKVARGALPKVGKRKMPRFTRDELWSLLTSESVPWDRRIVWAIAGLGGLRMGEAVGRRWRDLDTDTPGLWALTVATQYNDAPLKTAKDGATHERVVPVHPALRELLEAWRKRGFEATYGRAPRPDDWISCDPKTGTARNRKQPEYALHIDCEAVGIPRVARRATHAFRRTFISLARSDGARKDVLEIVTHNSADEQIDTYTSLEWPTLCAAVSALRFELRRAEVVPIQRPIAVGELDAQLDARSAEPAISEVKTSVDMAANNRAPATPSAIPAFLGTLSADGEPPKTPRSAPIPHRFTRVKLSALASAERTLRASGHEVEADAVAEAIALLSPP